MSAKTTTRILPPKKRELQATARPCSQNTVGSCFPTLCTVGEVLAGQIHVGTGSSSLPSPLGQQDAGVAAQRCHARGAHCPTERLLDFSVAIKQSACRGLASLPCLACPPCVRLTSLLVRMSGPGQRDRTWHMMALRGRRPALPCFVD